jgi:hypothetical protein
LHIEKKLVRLSICASSAFYPYGVLDVIHQGHFLACIKDTGFEGKKKVSHETNWYVTERKQDWKAAVFAGEHGVSTRVLCSLES